MFAKASRLGSASAARHLSVVLTSRNLPLTSATSVRLRRSGVLAVQKALLRHAVRPVRMFAASTSRTGGVSVQTSETRFTGWIFDSGFGLNISSETKMSDIVDQLVVDFKERLMRGTGRLTCRLVAGASPPDDIEDHGPYVQVALSAAPAAQSPAAPPTYGPSALKDGHYTFPRQ